MTLAANECMGTLAGGATVTKAFCFDCLTLLESDGETVKVTPMVPIDVCCDVKARAQEDVNEAVAVGEWLAKQGAGKTCARCGFRHICHDDYDKDADNDDESCASFLVEAARAAVRKQPEVTP